MILDMESVTTIRTEDNEYNGVYGVETVLNDGIMFYKFGHIAETPGDVEESERKVTAVRADTITSVEYAIIETANGRAGRI